MFKNLGGLFLRLELPNHSVYTSSDLLDNACNAPRESSEKCCCEHASICLLVVIPLISLGHLYLSSFSK